MTTPANPAPGWYDDPARPGAQRWWTGVSWSESTQPAPAPPAVPPPGALHSPPPGYSGQPSGYPGGPSAYAVPPPSYSGQAGYAQPSPYSGYGGVAAADLVPPGRPLGFGEAISAVFRSYASFGGRASRSEFWYWYLFCTLIGLGAYLLIVLFVAIDSSALSWIGVFATLLLIVFGLAIIVPSLAVTVRRLRDAGFPWPLIFLELVPYIGGIIVLILCAQRAKPSLLPRV